MKWPARRLTNGWESDFGRAVSRILSSLLRAERIICLSSQYPGPIPRCGTCSGPLRGPYLALHPMGFSVPPRLRLERWALTPPFHPYPAEAGRSVFCGTVRRQASRHCLPRVSFPTEAERLRGIAPFGVRTFLLHRRFRATEAILRPSKIATNIAFAHENATIARYQSSI